MDGRRRQRKSVISLFLEKSVTTDNLSVAVVRSDRPADANRTTLPPSLPLSGTKRSSTPPFSQSEPERRHLCFWIFPKGRNAAPGVRVGKMVEG